MECITSFFYLVNTKQSIIQHTDQLKGNGFDIKDILLHLYNLNNTMIINFCIISIFHQPGLILDH